ncbi:hypothetical protein BFJ71_g16635 [Fusarium oxysporum]|nr:hypothetical protein BFJ71_g16635 [Fusarium oxysporum]
MATTQDPLVLVAEEETIHLAETSFKCSGISLSELPDMNKKEVHIEFTEPQILVILGKSERSYTSGNHSAGLIEGPSMHGAIKDDGDDHNKSQPQRPEKSDKHDDKTKYWFAERSVREFSRTFSFLSYVDQDSVSVSLQARFLSIIVPKIRSMSPVASMLTARMYDGNKYDVVVEPSPIAS